MIDTGAVVDGRLAVVAAGNVAVNLLIVVLFAKTAQGY
jgi:hypothetical protein